MNIKHISQWFKLTGLITGLLCLASCTSLRGTTVNTAHHLISQEGESAFATVYILRPKTERAMGFADNSVIVELDGKQLLTIAKGEYTLIYMRPRVRTILTVENLTKKGRDLVTQKIRTDQEFAFASGESYYIVLEPEDGEFRGVSFKVKNVDLFHAKEIAEHLRPTGAARSAPISAL